MAFSSLHGRHSDSTEFRPASVSGNAVWAVNKGCVKGIGKSAPLGPYLPFFYTWEVDVMSGAPAAVLDDEVILKTEARRTEGA